MERNHDETIYGRIQHKVMMMMQGARIMENELMRKVYNKPVEISEKYPQGWFSENIKPMRSKGYKKQ